MAEATAKNLIAQNKFIDVVNFSNSNQPGDAALEVERWSNIGLAVTGIAASASTMNIPVAVVSGLSLLMAMGKESDSAKAWRNFPTHISKLASDDDAQREQLEADMKAYAASLSPEKAAEEGLVAEQKAKNIFAEMQSYQHYGHKLGPTFIGGATKDLNIVRPYDEPLVMFGEDMANNGEKFRDGLKKLPSEYKEQAALLKALSLSGEFEAKLGTTLSERGQADFPAIPLVKQTISGMLQDVQALGQGSAQQTEQALADSLAKQKSFAQESVQNLQQSSADLLQSGETLSQGTVQQAEQASAAVLGTVEQTSSDMLGNQQNFAQQYDAQAGNLMTGSLQDADAWQNELTKQIHSGGAKQLGLAEADQARQADLWEQGSEKIIGIEERKQERLAELQRSGQAGGAGPGGDSSGGLPAGGGLAGSDSFA